MVTLTDLLDLDDTDADEFLEGLQGNIVKGHGRDFTRHVFVRFGEDLAAVRRFLGFFPGGVGADAVISQNLAPVPQRWPSGGTVAFTIANFVKMLGGEYLYAPSMAFLRGLETTDGGQP